MATGPAAVVEVLQPGRADRLFVGRADEVDRLLELLAPGGDEPEAGAVAVAAVSGMGGIGKTALATHTALLAVERSWFTGGVVTVNLRGYDPDVAPVQPARVYASVLRALGVPAEQVPGTADEQASVYHLVLGDLAKQGRRVLVVPDNAADAGQVRDLLPRHHAHRALVTTRDVLDLPGSRRMPLDVLAEAEAVDLLTRTLRAMNPQDLRPAGEPDAVRRLARLCGLLPLAVEIVGAILTDEPALDVASLTAQLAGADTRLPGLAYGGPGVAAVIDFSYQRVAGNTPDAARLLPLLTVNVGPDLATETATAIAGTSSATAVVLLRALRAASLIQQTPTGRWQLHDLVALYARGHLTPAADGTATARLLLYYTATASAADDQMRALPGQPISERFPSQEAALAWFDAERANLIATVANACGAGHHQPTVDLASCLSEYLSWRRYIDDWVTVAKCAFIAATALGRPATLAMVLNNLGLALREVARFDEAIVAHQHDIAICRDLGDRRSEAMAWNNLAIALQEVRQFHEAVTAHQRARDIYHDLGDRRGEGMTWTNLGLALRDVGQFDEAVIALEHARDVHQDLGDRRREGMTWTSLGLALRGVGRLDQAIAALEHARDIHHDLGDRRSEGIAWNGLGVALRDVGRFDEAIAALQHDLAICQDLGDRRGEGGAWTNLGVALRDVGRFDEAIVAHQHDIAICQDLGDRHGEGIAWTNLGIALRESGRFDEAEQASNNAAAAYRGSGDEERAGKIRDWLRDVAAKTS